VKGTGERFWSKNVLKFSSALWNQSTMPNKKKVRRKYDRMLPLTIRPTLSVNTALYIMLSAGKLQITRTYILKLSETGFPCIKWIKKRLKKSTVCSLDYKNWAACDLNVFNKYIIAWLLVLRNLYLQYCVCYHVLKPAHGNCKIDMHHCKEVLFVTLL
jgi:hypothetical protein